VSIIHTTRKCARHFSQTSIRSQSPREIRPDLCLEHLRFYCSEHFVGRIQVINLRQFRFLGFLAAPFYEASGIVVTNAGFNTDLQNSPQDTDCVIKRCRAGVPAKPRSPIQAISLCDAPDLGSLQLRSRLGQSRYTLLLVFPCSWLDGCVPLQALSIHCKGIIHGHGTISHRNLMLGQLALLLFQVAEAQLGNRKHLGFEAAPNQLAANAYSCEIRF